MLRSEYATHLRHLAISSITLFVRTKGTIAPVTNCAPETRSATLTGAIVPFVLTESVMDEMARREAERAERVPASFSFSPCRLVHHAFR